MAHEWQLVPDDSSLGSGGDAPVTLSFAADAVAGTAPCNAYRGDYRLDGDTGIEFGPIALTRRACDDATMQAEDEYVAALGEVDHVKVSDKRLVLRGGDDVRLAYRAYDAEDLLAGTWDIVNVATGDAISSVVAGTEPTLTFADDGTLTMQTGCNTATSSWELDGDALTIDLPQTTKKACPEPPGVMEQEAALVRALRSTARVDIAPGELVLLHDDGTIALVATGGG
jgi:heat shock protein HslJ